MLYMKMLTSRWNAFLLLLLVGFSSCEKVIDLKLNDADKKVVIDGQLSDQAGDCVVKLSQTKNFNDDNSFIGLSGATVTIQKGNQLLSTLKEVTPGVYVDSLLKGTYGTAYTLTVSVNGQTYTALSTMPYVVPFDSLYVSKQSFFGTDHNFATVVLQDPAGVQNNYRCIQYVNNKRTSGDFILNDEYSDGKLFESTLYYSQDDGDSVKTGDVFKVELQCIDKSAYEYWFSFDQSASGGQGAASPANPVTNVQGGALGYFSAHTSQFKQVIVQ
jgi:hypothetical protein